MLIASNTSNTKWISQFYHFYPHSAETKEELIQISNLWKWFHLCAVLIWKLICCCCSVTKLCLTLGNPWTAAHQPHLSSTISWSLLKLISTELVMLSNYLILCHPFLHLPLILPSMRVFSWKDLFLKAISDMLIIANSTNSIYIISFKKVGPLFYKKLQTNSKLKVKIGDYVTITNYSIIHLLKIINHVT